MLNIYITGIGGQGVLTIAEIIARSAEKKGFCCNFYPTKGMAQRGGFVKAQLRISSSDSDFGPEISRGSADIAISMELSESLRAIPYLKDGGDFLVWAYKWLPTDVMLKKAPYPSLNDIQTAAKEAGLSVKILNPEDFSDELASNICLLAAAQAHTQLGKYFTADELKEAMLERFSKGRDRNLKSFEAGLNS